LTTLPYRHKLYPDKSFIMRAAVILAAVAPAAIGSAIPAFEEPSVAHSFDKREDITANTLGGKILSADLYAGVAGLNQQIYQATQKGDQWKKCNPLNIVVRREWCVILIGDNM
jgi:tyrosinase